MERKKSIIWEGWLTSRPSLAVFAPPWMLRMYGVCKIGWMHFCCSSSMPSVTWIGGRRSAQSKRTYCLDRLLLGSIIVYSVGQSHLPNIGSLH